MTITLEIGLELQAELVRQAAARGMGIDAYAACLLEEAAHFPVAPRKPKMCPPTQEFAEAIERLRVFGKTHGLSLQGMTIRELRDEVRP
jgi:hypothetical protein